MKTTEMNRKIAEFMGIEFDEDYAFGYEFDEYGNGVHIGELMYHESWDWLMPVIAKCYDLGCDPDSNAIGDITCELLECDLSNTHEMVVQYIDYLHTSASPKMKAAFKKHQKRMG